MSALRYILHARMLPRGKCMTLASVFQIPALLASARLPRSNGAGTGKLSQHLREPRPAAEAQTLLGAAGGIDAVDRAEHGPAAAAVELRIVREITRDHGRRVMDQRLAILGPERRRC